MIKNHKKDELTLIPIGATDLPEGAFKCDKTVSHLDKPIPSTESEFIMFSNCNSCLNK